MPATTLTAETFAALERVGCPVSTTDLTRLLNDNRMTPLVIDQVYRALTALRGRGAVRRLRTAGNKRVRYWEVADPPGACRCGAQGESS